MFQTTCEIVKDLRLISIHLETAACKISSTSVFRCARGFTVLDS